MRTLGRLYRLRCAAVCMGFASYFCGALAEPAHQDNPLVFAQADEAREPVVQAPQDLSVEAECDPVVPGDRSAVFTWTPPSGENVRQVLDITMFRDGFRTGKFRTIGRLSAREGRFVWPGGEPGISYLWRVRVIAPGDAASESEPARFDPPVCPVDFQPEGGDVEGQPRP